MELQEALEKASQILNEERAFPTVSYEPSDKFIAESSSPLAPTIQATAIVIATLQLPRILSQIRSQRPRPVDDNPRRWAFKSTNYDLLCALLAQVGGHSRPAFLNNVLLRMTSAPACACTKRDSAWAYWNALVSELPLVAEFCVRNGATRQLFNVLSEASPLPGHAILLRHLEDMIALDFRVFSDAEYEQLDFCVGNFRGTTERQLGQYGHPAAPEPWADVSVKRRSLLSEITEAAHGIREECRKARYFYVKGSLLNGLNIEINQDKDAVQSYLRTLGFTEKLARSLDEAERLYHEGESGFSLKASMGHLRSFLENLHEEAFAVLHAKSGEVLPETWGAGLTYLRENGVLSASEERFAGSLYTLISDQAVHPLVAEREYARLFRNVVIEYALLFLRTLEKRGLKRLQYSG